MGREGVAGGFAEAINYKHEEYERQSLNNGGKI